MVISNNDITSSDDEFEVANVLLDLPYLITNSLSTYRFPYDWGFKRKRSALVSPPPYSPPRCRKKVSAPPLQPPPPPSKAEASSPNTPLSFSPSESDSKSIVLLKKKKTPPLNLRKKELENTFKEKMVTQQQLKESIDKVKEYYNSLILENSMLRAKKQKLVMPACTTTTRMEQQQQTTTTVSDRVHAVPSTSSEYDNRSSYDQIRAGPLTSSEYHNRPPLISPLFQSNGGNDWATPYHHQLNSGNNWVHAGPPRATQFQQYHNQAPALIINHYNQRVDPVYAVPGSGMQMHYTQPLIPHHQNQRFVPDLNMEYKDQDQVCRERRAARLQAHKEKRPRVNPTSQAK